MSDPDIRDPLALSDYAHGAAVELTDAQRWPGMTSAQRRVLEEVLTDPGAPRWRHRAGHRLDAAAVARARDPLSTAGWLADHLAVARRLPAYRSYPDLVELTDFPLISRADLLVDIAAFVPLEADLSRMVTGSSSGTTGAALMIPDDVEDVARTFWLLAGLVDGHGIPWSPDPDRLALAYLVWQRQAFSYASLVPGFGAAAMARLNLDPRDWDPDARDGFLRRWDPQVFTGSPPSLAALLDSPVAADLHPLAVVSGAQHLSTGLRSALTDRFAVPVFDIYGLHETRPVAVSPDGGPFRLLPTRIHVEVVDRQGIPLPLGARGELVVTSGCNPLLPLVRYRTGDYGRLIQHGAGLAIADLEGREDVIFTAADGLAVPCVDVTQQLQDAGALGWVVEQDRNGVRATVCGGDPADIAARLRLIFGATVPVNTVGTLAELGEGKPRRYRVAP
ncbi:MAG: AMP-binding protein [Mycolicibacterium insubricum]|nr:phenylacetate--CoA ligase family protein [Mycobacterium sp.]